MVSAFVVGGEGVAGAQPGQSAVVVGGHLGVPRSVCWAGDASARSISFIDASSSAFQIARSEGVAVVLPFQVFDFGRLQAFRVPDQRFLDVVFVLFVAHRVLDVGVEVAAGLAFPVLTGDRLPLALSLFDRVQRVRVPCLRGLSRGRG